MRFIHLFIIITLSYIASGRRHPRTTQRLFIPTDLPVIDQTCIRNDECSCSFADGSGDVNLHSLQGPDNNTKFSVVANDGWTYKYNPCQSFQLGPYSLVVGQTNNRGGNYDIGVQSSMTFNTTEEGKLFVHYIAGDNDRRSRIILECDPNTIEHNLRFVGEIKYNPSLYEFVLTSPCACPGYCDDNGIVDDVIINSQDDDVEVPQALNRVEMRLAHVDNKLTNIGLQNKHFEADILKVKDSLKSIKRKISENSQKLSETNANSQQVLNEVEETLTSIESQMLTHEENFATYVAEQRRNERLVDASLPPLAALFIHDVFIVILIIALAHIFASTRRRFMKRMFSTKKQEKQYLYSACKGGDERIVKNI